MDRRGRGTPCANSPGDFHFCRSAPPPAATSIFASRSPAPRKCICHDVTEVNMTNTVASDTTTGDDRSKIEQVSQQTSEVIGSAREQATSVASTAREEVTGATQDAKEQAQRLVHESRRQLRRSADDQAR